MSIQINITRGYHRGEMVSGVFPLVKGYVEGASGGFVTVKVDVGTPWAKTNTPRIKLGKEDFTLQNIEGEELPSNMVVVDGQDASPVVTMNYEAEFARIESDSEALERMSDTFGMLDQITDACAAGIVRGLVVSGPPGIGKSHGVVKQLAAANLFRTISGEEPKYEIISGGISAIGLYQKLYHNRAAGQVLVFDDCDETLEDSEMLNLLKAALNSGDSRRICWNKESRVLMTEDIPGAFDFEGAVIFLSNVDFERSIARGSRISAHLSAIMSRCHYLDLEISSMRDRLLLIQVRVKNGMLDAYNFSDAEINSVLSFIDDNSEYLREVSLRMTKKIADFVKASPNNWYSMAEATCLSKDARFKRLYEKKQQLALDKGLVLC